MRITHEFPWRKWLLCSWEKWNGFHAFADLPNTIHHPPRLLPRCHRAASELIHYESDCGYKGHNIAYAIWRRFRSPVVLISRPPVSSKGRTRLIWSGLIAFVRCRSFYLGGWWSSSLFMAVYMRGPGQIYGWRIICYEWIHAWLTTLSGAIVQVM